MSGELDPSVTEAVVLDWRRFGSFIAARDHVGERSCVYLQAIAYRLLPGSG